MPKPVGLRTEILATLTFLMGAALLLGGVLMLRSTEQALLEQRLAQLGAVMETLSTSLAENYSSQRTTSGDQFSTNVLDRLSDDLNHRSWWLYSENLLVLKSQSEAGNGSFSASRLQQIKATRQPLRSVSFPGLLEVFSPSPALAKMGIPIIQGNRFVGLLEMDFSLEEIRYQLLFSQQVIVVYATLYGALLVFIGYYLLQRNIIKPARNLLRATEEVGRGNLKTRLPVAGPVELASLAEAYNNMVEALLASREETQTHISALQQTNQHLKIAREELIRSEKLASVGQLAAGLAHELGNPLAALIGYLEILKGRLAADESELVVCSLVEAERIDYLVRELLDFSRPSEVLPEEVDPIAVLRSAIDLLTRQGVFSDIQLVELFPEKSVVIKIDRNKLQQLFINILLNASYACSKQGRVTISVKNSTTTFSVTFEDNGCGIPEAELARIFDPFYTTKPPGEGTGLGLAVCHRIVDEAGGEIFVSSEISKGSLFRIELPVVCPCSNVEE